MYGYLKIFAQEGLGRPEMDVAAEVENIQAYLKKKLPPETFPEESLPPVQAALVFTNERATIDIPEDANSAGGDGDAKGPETDWCAKVEKGKGLTVEKIKLIEDAF